jgi:hypothetical protein
MPILIGPGIEVGPGIIIGDSETFPSPIITQNDDFIITESGDQLVTET